ncbi:MAG TPA: hypothetical protein PKC92_12540 [Bacteroidia bacterium]|jgi:hypothetical protein|nr:hypothetical protein [Bacteroidia bacterium]
MQTIPIKPIPNENRNNSLDISKHEIKQTIPDNNTYTLKTYQEYSAQPLDGRSIQIGPQRPEIRGFHSSLSGKTDLYHSFPRELDQSTINQGTWSQRISDYVQYNNVGYWFEAPGTINGVNGMLEFPSLCGQKS